MRSNKVVFHRFTGCVNVKTASSIFPTSQHIRRKDICLNPSVASFCCVVGLVAWDLTRQNKGFWLAMPLCSDSRKACSNFSVIKRLPIGVRLFVWRTLLTCWSWDLTRCKRPSLSASTSSQQDFSAGGGWRVTGGEERVTGGGWRVTGDGWIVKNKKSGNQKKKKENEHYKTRYFSNILLHDIACTR